MSAITDLLEQKAGLSPDKAQEVEQLVLQHISSVVPPEFQGPLNSLLGGGAASGQTADAGGGGLSSLLGAATSLFGGGNKS